MISLQKNLQDHKKLESWIQTYTFKKLKKLKKLQTLKKFKKLQ